MRVYKKRNCTSCVFNILNSNSAAGSIFIVSCPHEEKIVFGTRTHAGYRDFLMARERRERLAKNLHDFFICNI